jgi:hypothetical protein
MAHRLAQHLIARGLLSGRVVDDALTRVAQQGGCLDTALLEFGAVSEAGVLQAVSDVSGIRLVNLADFEPNAEVGALLPLQLARQLNVVPLSLDGNALHLASAFPIQSAQLKDLGFLLGRRLELWVALECRVRDWQAVLYGEPLDTRFARLLATLDPSRVFPAAAQAESLSVDVLERLARGIVEEPVLLDRPKKPKGAPATAPALEQVSLGAEEEVSRTTVFEPVAYERFAKAEHGADPAQPELGFTEADSTRVLDVQSYSNFARGLTSTEPAKPSEATQSRISFPGGVLPPRKGSSPPTPARPPRPATFVQPARAAADRVGPREAASSSSSAPPPPRAEVDTELDFSDVGASPPGRPPSSAPPKRAAAPPPRPPPPPDRVASPAVRRALGDPPPDAALTPPTTAHFDLLAAPTPPVPHLAFTRPPPIELTGRPPATPSMPVQPLASAPPASAPRASAPVVRVMALAEPPLSAATVATATATAASTILPAPPGLEASNAMEWSLAQARASLRGTTQSREALVSVLLEFGRRTFDFVAAFAVMRGAAVGWDARGAQDLESLRQVAIPLDAASVFRTVALTRGSYVGPLPPDALSQHYLALLGRSPRTVFLWPIEVQSRLVAILYGDCGSRPVSQRRLADFILFCQDLPNAFHELIVFRKQNPQVAQTLTAPTQSMDQWTVAQPVEVHPVESADAPGPDAEWFAGLVTLLTGPDPAERSMAMLELMKTPDDSARALAAAFPGPSGWSRLPVVELPEPDELGPVPGALARLGQAGAAALAPLLESSDSDARYLALLTAGSLRYPDVVRGVLHGLFDFEPDLSSAARSAAASLKFLPHFQQRLPELREELHSPDALRRSLAARALGGLHDRECIEGLIELTGSDDELCAQSAADALKEITRAGFGANPAAWSQWWAGARERRRIEWLVEALVTDDFDLRLSAIEELSRTFGDNFGYFADGPEAERAGAVERWQAVVASRQDLEL